MKTLSICIPCYLDEERLLDTVSAFYDIKEDIEICIFFNGSSDKFIQSTIESMNAFSVRYDRCTIAGTIDYSWSSVIHLASTAYFKLHLVSDMPVIDVIRKALAILNDEKPDYIVSPQAYRDEIGLVCNQAKLDGLNNLRRNLQYLTTAKRRSSFIFRNLFFGNQLGDIGGFIFKRELVGFLSWKKQIYYGSITHPDAELMITAIANGAGMHISDPLSFSTITGKSSSFVATRSKFIARRVYGIPGLLHGFYILTDPSLSDLRKNIPSYMLLYRIILWLTHHAVGVCRLALAS